MTNSGKTVQIMPENELMSALWLLDVGQEVKRLFGKLAISLHREGGEISDVEVIEIVNRIIPSQYSEFVPLILEAIMPDVDRQGDVLGLGRSDPLVRGPQAERDELVAEAKSAVGNLLGYLLVEGAEWLVKRAWRKRHAR
jgi:hypothetical protein